MEYDGAMSRAYRGLLMSVGGFLFVGGAFGLVFSITMTARAGEHVRSFIGGAIAAGAGLAVMRAAYHERMPKWLARLIGTVPETDD
jgi:hypothetical protein